MTYDGTAAVPVRSDVLCGDPRFIFLRNRAQPPPHCRLRGWAAALALKDKAVVANASSLADSSARRRDLKTARILRTQDCHKPLRISSLWCSVFRRCGELYAAWAAAARYQGEAMTLLTQPSRGRSVCVCRQLAQPEFGGALERLMYRVLYCVVEKGERQCLVE